MSFDPTPHLLKLPRRVRDPQTKRWVTVYDDYLEVKWRVVWFRDRYPHGTLETEEVCIDLDRVISVEVTITVDERRETITKTGTGYARFKARVTDGEGGVSTGTGSENAAEFADFVERAETRAIGRALSGLGIGTAFVGNELSDDGHVADAPVSRSVTTPTDHGRTPTNGLTPEVVAKMPKSDVVHKIGLRLRELVPGEGPTVRDARRASLQTAMGETVRGDSLDLLALSKLRAGLVALLAMSPVATPPEEGLPPPAETPHLPVSDPPSWETAVHGLLPLAGVAQLRQWATDLGLRDTLEAMLEDCPGYAVAPQITEDVFTRAIAVVAATYERTSAPADEEDVP